MKKNIGIVVFIAITLIIVIVANVALHEPPTLTESYINDNVLVDHYIEKILYSEITNDHIFCICSVDEDEMMVLILKNNDTYSMHHRFSFSLDSLNENSTEIKNDKTPFTNVTISYNVFLNPTEEQVTIDSNVCDIHFLTYKDYNIGFWWFEHN